ncbi:MAG: AI-2E family transporter [Oscillospiraceae bacterium]|nr:AI-2E family transporter [Oscillospiraceae bacterium]
MLDINKKTLRRIIFGVLACIFVYWLLHETDRVKGFIGTISDLLAPFVLGGVLAFILNVPMRAMENTLLKKVKKFTLKRVISIVLTFLAMLLVLALVFWLLIPQIVETINSLIPNVRAFFIETQTNITDFLEKNPQLLQWLNENTQYSTIKWDTLVEKALGILGNSTSAILGGAFSVIGTIFKEVFNAVVAVVFCVYCLFQKETLARQGRKLLYAFLKEKTADNVVRTLRLTNSTFSNFLSGQCVEVCILGTMFAICMAIFRMPYIPLISVVIAITAFIPIVGAWTGCVLGAFLIFVKDPMLAVWFVVMFVVLQQIENNMIYPRVVGTSVGLSGMWVLVAVSVGGKIMGVAGMFLMIPATSVIYVLVKEITNKKLSGLTVDSEKLQPQPPELARRMGLKRKKKKNAKPVVTEGNND